ncbi:MAG: isoprenylcysteine carboxylmethyltransferase family protein [Nitrospirota bacterium]
MLAPTDVFSDEVKLTLSHYSVDNVVTVNIENNSKIEVFVEDIYIDLNHERYRYSYKRRIMPQETLTHQFPVTTPTVQGTYPLTAVVSYLNEGRVLSLKHAALFNYLENSPADDTCTAESVNIKNSGYIKVKSSNPHSVKLILPDELVVMSRTLSSEYALYKVKSLTTGLKNKYPYFAYIEDISYAKHSTSLCKGYINVGSLNSHRGTVPPYVLLLLSALFLCVICFNLMPKAVTLTRYASRMFLITFSYYLLQNIDLFLGFTLNYINNYSYHYLATIALNNFRGSNYSYFFQYFVDLYMVVCLVVTFPYLYYYDNNKAIDQDKYVSLLRSICSVPGIFINKTVYWNKYSKLGMLTYMIKLFYIPYLTSWVINNTIHQNNLTMRFHWGYAAINEYLTALFIYIDTVVFSFGYIIESKMLKNEIKSAEPTAIGWIVCLWCYPPFNQLSFKIFDYGIIDMTYPRWVVNIIIGLITILWGIFAWASITLGAKSSNLTNRGIVKHGPYKYVRHPAYTAKIIVWFLQGIFLSQYSFGILLGFTLIYVLRAITEERHLSLDENYLDYKKSVKWKFIPKII